MPANCTEPITEPGATAPTTPPWDRPASGSALALGTLSVGAPEVRWTQGGREFCVAYSAASAVHWRHPPVRCELSAAVRGSSSVDEEAAAVFGAQRACCVRMLVMVL